MIHWWSQIKLNIFTLVYISSKKQINHFLCMLQASCYALQKFAIFLYINLHYLSIRPTIGHCIYNQRWYDTYFQFILFQNLGKQLAPKAIENHETEYDCEVLCPGCSLGDDISVTWYGCDICPAWWHRQCLPQDLQEKADASTKDKSIIFRCPQCPLLKMCGVCFIEGENSHEFAQCSNCKAYYHFDCLPEAVFRAFEVFKQNKLKWYCSQCDTEI